MLSCQCANLMRWMTKNSEGRMKGRGFEEAVSVMSGADITLGLKEAGLTKGGYTMFQVRTINLKPGLSWRHSTTWPKGQGRVQTVKL